MDLPFPLVKPSVRERLDAGRCPKCRRGYLEREQRGEATVTTCSELSCDLWMWSRFFEV